jgi:hypothetical protein
MKPTQVFLEPQHKLSDVTKAMIPWHWHSPSLMAWPKAA